QALTGKTLTQLTVPEFTPARPFGDPRFGERVYALPWTAEIEKAWSKGDLKTAANAVFKTEKTGRQFLAPRAEFKKVSLADSSMHNIWFHVRTTFNGSGLPAPARNKPVLLVSTEGVTPLAAADVVVPAFDVPVPQHRFLATKAPKLAGYPGDKPLTGVAVMDY